MSSVVDQNSAYNASFEHISNPVKIENWSNYGYNHWKLPRMQSRDQYYNLEKKPVAPRRSPFFCEPCSQSFYTKNQYTHHVNQHIDCPFPQCKFSADMKVIDKHISHQHMMVNFDELHMDDEAWVANRKKRFPSIRRAEMRRAQFIEKQKRGERINMGKAKFLDRGGNQFFQKGQNGAKGSFQKVETNKRGGMDNKSSNNGFLDKKVSTNNEAHSKTEVFEMRKNNRFKKGKGGQQREFVPATPKMLNVDLDDSDNECKNEIPAFKGTRTFYENTGELSHFRVAEESDEDSMDSNIQSFAISDDEWEGEINKDKKSDVKLQFNNALGSLIGAYDSGSDGENSNPDINVKISDVNPNAENVSSYKDNNSEEFSKKRKRFHSRNNKSKGSEKALNSQIRNKPRPYLKRRRPYLLERLLAPEIKHERNLILQCVHYVVENNFFQSSQKENN